MAAPAIGIRPRWSPGVNSKVDRSHPLAQRLVAAHVPIAGVGAVDLAGNNHLPLSNTPAHGAGAFGPEMVTTGTQSGASLTIGTGHPLSLQPPLSFMWVGTKNTAEDDGAPCYGVLYSSSGDDAPFACYQLQWSNTRLPTFEWNDGSYQVLYPAPQVEVGPHVIICTLATGAANTYTNGLRVMNTATGIGTITYSSTSIFGLHCSWPNHPRDPGVGSAFGAVWNRELSANEVAELAADPFCFLTR